MTWRTIWGEPFPDHADHATEQAAHAHALQVSREQCVEVAVVEIGEVGA